MPRWVLLAVCLMAAGCGDAAPPTTPTSKTYSVNGLSAEGKIMTEADLVKIESALGYSLPAHYRTFILQHGNEIRRIENALPLRSVLYTDPEEMIDANNFSRTGDVFRLGEGQLPWPENYLLVATDGGGDYWYVHRDGADPGVWFWSHESCETKRDSASLDDYLKKLRADMLEPEQWQFPAN